MSEARQEDDGPLADEREAFQGLYILSLPDDLRDRVFERLRPVDLQEVANVIATAPFKLVYKLHAVASALNRRPDLADDEANVGHLANALGRPDSEQIREGLVRFARSGPGGDPPPPLTPERWGEFVEALGLEGEDLDTELESAE